MRKTAIYVLSVFILGLSIFSISARWEYLIGGYGEKEQELEEKVYDYLMTDKGYSDEDVEEITASYNRTQEDYFAEVIFSDEKGTKYIYVSDDRGEIIQVGYGYLEGGQDGAEEAGHLEQN